MIEMTYVFTNPHPKGLLTGDCVVRAFSLAFKKDYLETRRELNRAKHRYGHNNYKQRRTFEKLLYELNAKKITIVVNEGESRPRAKEFYERYGDGIYILSMRRHITTMVDGQLLDTWDSSNKPIYTAWRIPE